jgi:hypothetical protein
MIEIALCIAVIAFALLAVAGVLPRGQRTQRDNRADTIMAQDAVYWMEAIRNGAHGLDELTNFVDYIIREDMPQVTNKFGNGFTNGYDIVGLLSAEVGLAKRPQAVVGAITRSAVLQGDFAFKYLLEVDIQKANVGQPGAPKATQLELSEVTVSLRQIGPNGQLRGLPRVLRAQVNGAPREDPEGSQRFFFRP